MRRLYQFGILGLSVLFFLGWMLNCTGLKSTQTPRPIPDLTAEAVVSSEWITADQWVTTKIFGLPARACEINNNKLTNNTLENGQLYVYSKMENNVRPLPFTINTPNNELRVDYTLPKSSTLRIVSINLRGGLSPVPQQQYRYLLIPNSLVKKLSVNMGDYEEVKTAFHLED